MFWWLAFAVFLYVLFVMLMIAEVFVPSGGLLSLCALACLTAGTIIFFKQSTIAGIAAVILAIVLVPGVLGYAYKAFPNTRFGKRITLSPPERQPGQAVPDAPALKELLGAIGVVITPLRPVGTCDFAGRRVECVAESGYVDKNANVEVIDVRSTQIKVRVVEQS